MGVLDHKYMAPSSIIYMFIKFVALAMDVSESLHWQHLINRGMDGSCMLFDFSTVNFNEIFFSR